MYRFFLAFALFVPGLCFSQDSPVNHTDTSLSINSYYDSLQKADLQRMSERSINYFADLQRQRDVQQKKKAILYVVMGVLFLAVFIVGLARRRKK